MRKKQKKTNRSGIQLEVDGIKFRSKLEAYTYRQLKDNNIFAEYEKHSFELLPEIQFEFNDKKTNRVLSLNYTPDFVGEDFIIECKGHPNERFPIVWKLFKHYLLNVDARVQLYLVRTIKQVDNMIKDILDVRQRKSKEKV